MGEVAGPLTNLCANNFANANSARVRVFDIVDASGIHKEHEFAVPDAVGNFWSQLMQPEDFYFGLRELPFKGIGGAPGDAVIATKGITVCDDQNSGRHEDTEIAKATSRRDN